jgi:S1-C subfamily serine protease
MMRRMIGMKLAAGVLAWSMGLPAIAATLVQTVAAVKPSIVGIGTQMQTRSPAIVFSGTGFVVGDGLSVITNAHVVPNQLDGARLEQLGIVIPDGTGVRFRAVQVIGVDRQHDLAHLRFEGAPLPAMRLGEASMAAEGQALAFTGFPLGMVLGLYPATHRALLAAVTPIMQPSLSARRLDARAVAQLQRTAFSIYQLDGTAYPGNSGSPLYDPDTGQVLGVINMVFVKGLKETAITAPSGITYAIPVRHVKELLAR